MTGKGKNRIIAYAMVFVLCLSLFPISALAEEPVPEAAAQVQQPEMTADELIELHF